MPRRSLDDELDELLAESHESTRFRDLSLVLRRLTLSATVPEGAELTDEQGRVFVAGEASATGLQPVRSVEIGASTRTPHGARLRWSGGEVQLVADVLLRAGGVWDSQRRTWRLDEQGARVPAAAPVVVDLQESQVDAAVWFAERLAAFRARRVHPHAAGLCFDDRRGGKTFICTVLILCAIVDCPTIDGLALETWLVTQTQAARDEIEVILRAVIPPDWYQFREQPKRVFTFLHGPKLHCKTTDDVESLRVGRCDFALFNEAALLPEAAYDIVGRSLQDKRGAMLLTTNRPKRRRGNWVTRVWESAERDAREGIEPAVKLLRVPPSKNAAVDQAAKSVILRALAYARDPDEADATDEGLIAEVGETVCSPMWDDAKCIRPLPTDLEDVTEEVTKLLHGRPFGLVVGADFQTECAGSAFKLLAPGGDLSRVQLWATDSWFLAGGGDEDDLIDVMESAGILPGSALVVGDCSGGWQRGSHGYGPVSFATFQRRGWTITGVTKKKTDKGQFPKNPDVPQSTQRLRKLIAEGRLFCTPAARILSLSLRKCEARRDAFGNVRPKANTKYSHNLDTARYVAWWLTARPEALRRTPLPAYVRAAAGR